MANIRVTCQKIEKAMKPMHGGGQPPLRGASTGDFHYLTEAGIPYSRLHDVGGEYGGGRYVDVPNIFRCFEADENDPQNYDFTFTDVLIRGLVEAGVEPYFRLGVTIENYYKIKPYRIDPPKDYEKWARICEHIIRHYTEGWANGFHEKITYWEIWNEPENPPMWTGTQEQYFALYDVTAKHLKHCFPHLKIGGYASCGLYAAVPVEGVEPSRDEKFFISFFHDFFAYIREHGSPIDFFSWHSYADTQRTAKMEAWLHAQLVEKGYESLETHLNEWDPYHTEYGTAHHSAEVAAMMIAMQQGHTDLCCIYDMRTNTAPYCPLFDIRTHKPQHAYYAMVAFGRLYRLGQQVALTCDQPGLYALAASNGRQHALLLSNLSEKTLPLCIEGVDTAHARYYVLDDTHLLSWAPHANAIETNQVVLVEW